MIRYKFLVSDKRESKSMMITIADDKFRDEVVVEKLQSLIGCRPSLKKFFYYKCIERSLDRRG